LLGKKLRKLAEMIVNTKGVYVLTGAGVSTESGIPDFRSPGEGLWEKIDPIKYTTVQVLHEDPERFYRVGFVRFLKLKKAKPNRSHYALAVLEKHGYLQGLITQNIDGLHSLAGSKNVWEIHGHLRSCRCLNCAKEHPWETLSVQLEEEHIPPLCPQCKGMLRPNVVLFGDPMPHFFFELERELRKKCSLLIVIGSSLEVYPAAGLPRYADELVIINKQPTPYDLNACLVFHENCGEILIHLLDTLNISLERTNNGFN
jgi:NAD-dependent deacetylase